MSCIIFSMWRELPHLRFLANSEPSYTMELAEKGRHLTHDNDKLWAFHNTWNCCTNDKMDHVKARPEDVLRCFQLLPKLFSVRLLHPLRSGFIQNLCVWRMCIQFLISSYCKIVLKYPSCKKLVWELPVLTLATDNAKSDTMALAIRFKTESSLFVSLEYSAPVDWRRNLRI